MALINRTLIIFKYLWEISDESHTVSLADISAYLKQYDIAADPRTLRKDIEQLVEFGVDVASSNVASFYKDIHMYVTGAQADTLYTKLRYVKPTETGQNYSVLTSFELPKYASEYYMLQPKNDSIVIKVEAEGKLNEDLKAFAKYSFSELNK